MSNKGKKKCPQCGRISLEMEYEDCVLCGGGEYWHCAAKKKCGCTIFYCDAVYEVGPGGTVGRQIA